MPIAALGLNIAWEWTYAVRDLTHDPQLQAWVNLIWADFVEKIRANPITARCRAALALLTPDLVLASG
jgi:hypothetical protein